MGDPGLVTLLQFSDGLFPAGGFAHSFGLETLVADGRVRDRAALEAVVASQLEGTAGPCDSVAVVLASRLAARGDVPACVDLDQRLDAMKIVPEVSAASRQMGRQTLRIAMAIERQEVVAALWRAVERGQTPGHHPVAFGAALGVGGVDAERAALAFLYSSVTLMVSAGVRLIPLGQLDGQRVIAAMRERLARLAARAAETMDPEDMWTFNPGLEVAAIRHATLDARLFRS